MVERRSLTQWFFKITDYAQRLLDDVDVLVEWRARARCSATGSAEAGASVIFTIEQTGERIEVFTTRPDTLWGVTFFVFSIDHPAVERLLKLGGVGGRADDQARSPRLDDRPRGGRRHEEGAFLGCTPNPVNGERVPVFAAPYVLMEYGTGAIMAVPARRARLRVRTAASLPVRW